MLLLFEYRTRAGVALPTDQAKENIRTLPCFFIVFIFSPSWLDGWLDSPSWINFWIIFHDFSLAPPIMTPQNFSSSLTDTNSLRKTWTKKLRYHNNFYSITIFFICFTSGIFSTSSKDKVLRYHLDVVKVDWNHNSVPLEKIIHHLTVLSVYWLADGFTIEMLYQSIRY